MYIMKLSCTLLVTLAVSPSATAMDFTSVGGKNLASLQQAAAAKRGEGDKSSGGGGGGAALRKTNLPANIDRDASNQQVLATCSGEDEFMLEGYFDSSYDGCYSSAAAADGLNDDVPFFSLGGSVTDGLYILGWIGDSDLDDYIWAIAEGDLNAASSGIEFFNTCIDASLDAALDTHPTLVTTWACSQNNFQSSSSITTDPPFSLTCGCSTDDGDDTGDISFSDDDVAGDTFSSSEDASSDSDVGDFASTNAAAASAFATSTVVFSAITGKIIVGLAASILGSVVFV